MQLHKTKSGNFSISKLLVSLLLLMSFSSCYNVNKSEAQTPSKLLSESEMVIVLTEIQIAEAGFSINKNRKDADSLKPEYYDKILSQYSITLHQFKENVDYYHHSPKEMEKIYEQVLENLSKVQSEVILEEEEYKKQKTEDSITIINDSLNLILVDSLKINIP